VNGGPDTRRAATARNTRPPGFVGYLGCLYGVDGGPSVGASLGVAWFCSAGQRRAPTRWSP